MMESVAHRATEWAGAVVWPSLAALAVLLGFWLAAGLLGKPFARLAARDRDRAHVFRLLAGLVYWGMMAAGGMTALGTLGIDITALVAGLGLTGLTIGFALKDVASSLMAGVLLMTYRPFRRGDRVIIAGLEGTVEGLDMRYTHLAAEGKRYLVPNATVLTSPVTILTPPAPPATP